MSKKFFLLLRNVQQIILFGPLVLCACTPQKPAAIQYDSGWHTYRNEKYGYEIRYPDGYEIWETGPEAKRDGGSIRIGLKEYEAPVPVLDIQVSPKVSMQEMPPTPQDMIVTVTDVEINGVGGKQIEYYWKANGELFMAEVYLEGVLFRFRAGSGLDDFHATPWWDALSTFRFFDIR